MLNLQLAQESLFLFLEYSECLECLRHPKKVVQAVGRPKQARRSASQHKAAENRTVQRIADLRSSAERLLWHLPSLSRQSSHLFSHTATTVIIVTFSYLPWGRVLFVRLVPLIFISKFLMKTANISRRQLLRMCPGS